VGRRRGEIALDCTWPVDARTRTQGIHLQARAGRTCEAIPMPSSSIPNPFARASYLLAAHTPAQLPPDSGAEVAFAGRSNAGKSSALNALCQQNALARVSKTPGRTQQLVYFALPPFADAHLVDLPGYGYARVPRDLITHWREFIAGYFASRQALRGLVVVMDIRHPLKPDDLTMLSYAANRSLPAHVLLTKADKLGRGQQAQTRQAVGRTLAARFGDSVSVQVYSAQTRAGVDEARAVVAGWLDLQPGNAPLEHSRTIAPAAVAAPQPV